MTRCRGRRGHPRLLDRYPQPRRRRRRGAAGGPAAGARPHGRQARRRVLAAATSTSRCSASWVLDPIAGRAACAGSRPPGPPARPLRPNPALPMPVASDDNGGRRRCASTISIAGRRGPWRRTDGWRQPGRDRPADLPLLADRDAAARRGAGRYRAGDARHAPPRRAACPTSTARLLRFRYDPDRTMLRHMKRLGLHPERRATHHHDASGLRPCRRAGRLPAGHGAPDGGRSGGGACAGGRARPASRYRPVQWGDTRRWRTYPDRPGGDWYGFDAVLKLDGLPQELLGSAARPFRGACGRRYRDAGWLAAACRRQLLQPRRDLRRAAALPARQCGL